MQTSKRFSAAPSWATAFALILLLGAKAGAQTAARDEAAAAQAPSDQTVVMTPFDVDESNDQGYHSTNSAGITRLADPIQNLPVDVQVFNATVINDLDVTKAAQLGRFMVATQDHGSSGTAATIYDMRGFTSGIPDDQQRDGFRFTGIVNLYNIDRVEVIMGPNSVVQGAADPGGQVNVITKSAKTRQEFTSFEAQGGSFGSYRGAIDSNFSTRSANNDFALRINAVYEHSPTFIKFSNFDFRGIALALKDDLGKNTTFEAKYEFVNEVWVPWANIPDRWSGAPGLNGGFDMALNMQIPKIYNYDEANATAGPDAVEKNDNNYLEGQITHRFTESLNFFLLGEYSNELNPELLTPSLSPTIGYNAASNSFYVNRAYAWSHYSDDRYNLRALLNYDLNLGWMDQDIIAGYSELWVQDETLQDNLDANGTSTAVVDQTPLSPTAFTYANYGLFNQLANRHWGAIAPVADHVSNPSYYVNSTGSYFNGKIKTIFGYSWNSVARTDYTFAVPAGSFYQGTAARQGPTSSVAYTQKAEIPMASIVFAVTPQINYFIDYSKSYKPQTLYQPTLNLTTGAVTGSIGPQTGIGYDSGFKFDYTKTSGLSGSIDAYDVTEGNVSQVLNTNIVAALLGVAASLQQRYYVPGTAQRDRGIEVQLFYNPNPSWSIYANYAYSSAFISQSTEQPALVGEEANDHSKNDFNLFAKYTYIDGPLKGWFIGPNVSARSRYYRIQANEYGSSAGYGILNALLGYSGKWGSTRYTVQVNVGNVFNKIYVRTYALIGEPREFTVSARLSF